MNVQSILSITDHTLLRVGCTKEEIAQLCGEAVKYYCASVCIPPCYVRYAKECISAAERVSGTESDGSANGVRVCTVAGFPNGYSTAAVKAAEAAGAVSDGADEVDMVINVSFVKNSDWDAVSDEISLVRKACEGIILKVIIETCLLTDEEKIRLCRIVTECGADYIKTSTGFSSGGATVHDVRLMREHAGSGVGVKAAGGIHSLVEAQALIDAGASRIGASSIVKAVQEQE